MSQFVVLTELYEKSSTSLYTRIDSEGNRRTSQASSGLSIRKVVVNKEHIVLLREDTIANEKLKNKEIGLGLNEMQEFTRIYVSSSPRSSSYMTVVGSLSLITEKLTHDDKSS